MQSVFLHLSLSNVSKSVLHVHTVYEVFSTILPKNTYKNSNFSFYTKRETLLIQCYLIIFLPTVQSSMTSIFKEIFYYATVHHFAQEANFFPSKSGRIFFHFKKKNSRRKKSSLFLKATIHFDSSRTTSKWVGPFLLQTFSSGFPLVWCLLLFLSLIPTFYCLEWLHL